MPKARRHCEHRKGCKQRDSGKPIGETTCECFEVVETDYLGRLEERNRDLAAVLLLAQQRLVHLSRAVDFLEIVSTVAKIDRVLNDDGRKNLPDNFPR